MIVLPIGLSRWRFFCLHASLFFLLFGKADEIQSSATSEKPQNFAGDAPIRHRAPCNKVGAPPYTRIERLVLLEVFTPRSLAHGSFECAARLHIHQSVVGEGGLVAGRGHSAPAAGGG